ncbi:DNA topology modulation protein [Jeotgalibacillus salarius]|uniref:DNA topology modulation protein n=1 Tax=Jeotgalibacillus salarius TaxID=546023 RepID=A0A4Y8LHT4_9BACL|nr:DNA topology modulation protein [Jeotgalibacillus salarius]TFE02038.1 DNA topology modulation protein [Jeotgalibacillus salarius]
MKRILIIGSGGAGKSTLSKQLGEKLSIPVYHLDTIFWKPGWTPTDRDIFRAEIEHLMAADEWIMDGNFGGTLDSRLQRCDTVIFLHYSRWTCLLRAVKRRLMYHGKSRPDMTEGCKEKIDLDFLKWIYFYNDRQAPQVIEKLSRSSIERIVHLKSPSATSKWFNNLPSSYSK